MAHRRGEPDLPARRGGGRGLSRRRAPDRLRGAVDSHAHLQHPDFDADRHAVIERAVAAGIERILVPGWDVASSDAALELAAQYPAHIHAAVGVHPHHAVELDERAWAALEKLASDPAVRAIGEIGLDYVRNLSPPDVQRDAFSRQLSLAGERDLPVLVHDREAHRDVIDALLGRDGARPRRDPDALRGVLHAFSGDGPMAERLVRAGYVVGFALPVAFRSATGPRRAAATIGSEAFLVETDAPYLGPDARARNEPTTVLRVLAELARLRGTTPDDVTAHARRTYWRMAGD